MFIAEIPGVNVSFLLGVCFLVGLVIIIGSSWFLMRSLRTRSSRSLFSSSSLLLIWVLFSDYLFFWAFSYHDPDFPYPYLEGSAIWVHLVAPGALVLVISVSFALVTRTVVSKKGVLPRNHGRL